MGYQDVFKRYEIKYLLNRRQKENLLIGMEKYMKLDQYGRTTINNIYYDTPQNILVRRSLEKPLYKEKLRVRSYGTASLDSTVFVELKKKYDSVVYKRRISVTEKEASNYLNHGIKPDKQNQITKEIDYFCNLYEGLAPAMYLSYEREAFFGIEDPELRMTIDENILWRRDELSLCKGAYGNPLLNDDQSLLEIKIAGAMPLWMAQLLSQNGIYQTSFSKYGFAYLQELQEQIQKTEIIGNYSGKQIGGRKYA